MLRACGQVSPAESPPSESIVTGCWVVCKRLHQNETRNAYTVDLHQNETLSVNGLGYTMAKRETLTPKARGRYTIRLLKSMSYVGAYRCSFFDYVESGFSGGMGFTLKCSETGGVAFWCK